jgi:hypothetical protein
LTCPTSTFDNNDEERPCETYRQFMDSSRQERTFMIEKLVGKLITIYIYIYIS